MKVDLVRFIQELNQDIALKASFNYDRPSEEVDKKLLLDGETELNGNNMSRRLLMTLKNLFKRTMFPKTILFPQLINFYFSQEEKETISYGKKFFKLVEEIVEKRERELQDPSFKEPEDLLKFMLNAEPFKNDRGKLIDNLAGHIRGNRLNGVITQG